jgi:predicted porin
MSFWYRNGVCSNNTHSHRQNRNWIRTPHKLGAFSGLCVLGVVAHAQDTQPAGLLATFDITQRLEYSDNPDLEENGSSDTFGRTILGFGLESVTALQTFTLNIGTDIEEGRDDQSSFDVTNPFVQLDYNRATRNASVGAFLRYRESDANSSFFEDDFLLDSNVINQDNGTRLSVGYGLSGAIGVEAPIGANFDLSFDEITFTGTDDPDLTDQSTANFDGQINFRLDPRIVARLTTRYQDFDAQGNGVNRKTTGFGVGASFDVTQTLLADLAVSQDRIERSGDETGVNDGLSLDGSLVQTLTNGSLGLSFGSDVSSNDTGRRSFVSIDRDLDLPRGGTLSYSLGVTESEDSGIDPLLGLNYAYDLPTARVSVGLTQEVSSDSDNQEEINTAFNASYTREINALSSLGASLEFLDRNALGDSADDAQRVEVSLTYEYTLTRDWGVVSGVSHTLSTSDGDPDRSRNTIFIGLQRSFAWSP